MARLWKNNKTGNIYTEVGEAIDATNGSSCVVMVYKNEFGVLFVRDINEFLLKFTPHSVSQETK